MSKQTFTFQRNLIPIRFELAQKHLEWQLLQDEKAISRFYEDADVTIDKCDLGYSLTDTENSIATGKKGAMWKSKYDFPGKVGCFFTEVAVLKRLLWQK